MRRLDSATTIAVASTNEPDAIQIEGRGTVKATFADGEEIAALGDGAYWAPSVSVLWFETGMQLFAVQLLAFTGNNTAARDLARSIAEAALPNL